jgi:hypothetical protein
MLWCFHHSQLAFMLRVLYKLKATLIIRKEPQCLVDVFRVVRLRSVRIV